MTKAEKFRVLLVLVVRAVKIPLSSPFAKGGKRRISDLIYSA